LSTHQIIIEGIEITLRKNRRARHMIISIKPLDGTIVSIPQRFTFSDGEDLARQKIDWIRTHLEKIQKMKNNTPIIYGSSQFETRNHKLDLHEWGKDNISVRLSQGKINIKYPVGHKVDSLPVQKAIRLGIEKAYREEAKEYLPKRLNDLSDNLNLPFKEVFIKNIKSRWGSCSSKGNINLSIHLMRLPDHLIDYVLLHELAHTKVRNHSKVFWSFLETLLEDSKKLDKELKKYKIS
jgi:predicted metal-dependent hydrolase